MKKVLAVLAVVATVSAAGAVRADSWTDIRAAVYYNQEAEVVRLLDSGVSINIQNSDGWTPLHVAAEQGNLRMVRYLLARGADANIKTARGRTAFDVASGYAEVQAAIKARMAAPVDPFAAYLGGAPAPQPQPQAQPAPPAPGPLGGLGTGAGPNDGRSPAMRPRLEARDAVWYNNPAQLVALLDAGLNVNALDETETLLHAAAWRDRVDIARILLQRGASTTIRDKDGKLPRDYAQSPEMRALLGGGQAAAPAPAPVAANAHCQRMWNEATVLCGASATSCKISASIQYQSCLKTGTWY
jgi:ankyrin repeat protein